MQPYNSLIKKEETVKKIEDVVGTGKVAAQQLDNENYGKGKLSESEQKALDKWK